MYAGPIETSDPTSKFPIICYIAFLGPREVLVNWRGGTKAQPSSIRRASPASIQPCQGFGYYAIMAKWHAKLLKATWGGGSA